MRFKATACIFGLLTIATPALAGWTSTLVTDGTQVRTVYDIDETALAGTYEIMQSSAATACINAPLSSGDTKFSVVVTTECAPIGIVAPASPQVKIFSADVQKQSPCPQVLGHCIFGYILLRVHGYWQGTLVLTTSSTQGEPLQTLTIPVTGDNYENIAIRLQGSYSNEFTVRLRLLGNLGGILKETSRAVSVLPQPTTEHFWVASAEYAPHATENLTVVVAHVAPRSALCFRLTFENGYTIERPINPTDFIGGPFASVAQPSELRIGTTCAAAEAQVTEFTRLEEIQTGGGGGGSPIVTEWQPRRLA